jgi:predicted metal-dependent hydrolase
MTPHEKTILLIANLGMSNKKVSEITQKSLGTINQTKVKNQTRYKFTELDYNKIINYIKRLL